MPHKTEIPTIEKSRLTLRQRARKAGALITASAALSGLAAPAASAGHFPGKSSGTEIASTRLRNPQELPGLRIHLGREVLNRLKASTVGIVSRLKVDSGGLPEGSWSPSCTAVKVSIPGQKEPYIMTAAHCFEPATGVPGGAFTDPGNPENKAENFTNFSPFEYAVVDPNVDLNDRLLQPVARVKEISISTDNKDVALLRPVAVPISAKAYSTRKFSDIPAIPLRVAEMAPLQGTPVALVGVPHANGFEPIVGTGVYLGRVSFINPIPNMDGRFNNGATHRIIDLVGINPSDPRMNICNGGASGEMPSLPNGKLLGNLTIQTGKGYWGLGAEQLSQDHAASRQYWTPIWEDQLNVKLGQFSIICGYTVMDANTPEDLLDGFKNLAPGYK